MEEDPSSGRVTCLPEGVMLEILSHLPAKSLLKFKCVSKSWNSLLSNSFFIDMHYDNRFKLSTRCSLLVGQDTGSDLGFVKLQGSSMTWEPMGIHEPDPLKFVGVSKGLVCLTHSNSLRYGCEFLVINPALRKSKVIVRKLVKESKRHKDCFLSIGFGFDKAHNDFKIVRVERLNDSGVRVNIYSLSTDCWKKMNCSENFMLSCPTAIHSGNFLYWNSNIGKEVTVFNLSSERFYHMPLPRRVGSRCGLLQAGEHGLFGVIVYNPEDRSCWRWIVTPTENADDPYIWRKDILVERKKVFEDIEMLHTTMQERLPAYKNLKPIWGYSESIVQV